MTDIEPIRWQRLRTGRVGELVALVFAFRGEIGLELDDVSGTSVPLSPSYSPISHATIAGVNALGTAALDASTGEPTIL